MFSGISHSPGKSSRRTATLCSAAGHAAAAAALWAVGQSVTAPPMPHHEPREAMLIVSPPPQLLHPRPQPKADMQRFEVQQPATPRRPETIRAMPEAPTIEMRTDPATALPQTPAIVVTKPAAQSVGFAEIARAAAPKLELESRPAAFGSALGKWESTSVLPTGVSTGFGAVGLARTQSPAVATGGGGFGGAEVERAARRIDTAGEAVFGAAERRIEAASAPAAVRSKNRPVKILWKSVPQYSEEGLRRRIEGDVVLLVRFLARGTVETVEVVSGLGYGLDEHALRAAEAIRFEPATEGDQPVDYTAQLRIRFELAY